MLENVTITIQEDIVQTSFSAQEQVLNVTIIEGSTTKSSKEFNGVLDFSKDGLQPYNDYSGAIINTLSLSATKKAGSTITARVKGGSLATDAIPTGWTKLPAGVAITENTNHWNRIDVQYISDTNITIIVTVLDQNFQPIEVPSSDSTAPIFAATFPKTANITATTFDVQIQINEAGTGYVLVVADGAAAPTTAAIKAGQNIALVANTTGTINVTGKVASTPYDVYVIATDSAGNDNTAIKIDVSTAAASDTIAPTITSATIENSAPSNVVVLFNEVVSITDLTGISIAGTGAPTINSVSGTGTNTLTFVLSAAATGGETWTFEAAGTNTITDGAGNPLAVTSQAITNNVVTVTITAPLEAATFVEGDTINITTQIN